MILLSNIFLGEIGSLYWGFNKGWMLSDIKMVLCNLMLLIDLDFRTKTILIEKQKNMSHLPWQDGSRYMMFGKSQTGRVMPALQLLTTRRGGTRLYLPPPPPQLIGFEPPRAKPMTHYNINTMEAVWASPLISANEPRLSGDNMAVPWTDVGSAVVGHSHDNIL